VSLRLIGGNPARNQILSRVYGDPELIAFTGRHWLLAGRPADWAVGGGAISPLCRVIAALD
jgi:hypothetical protein